MPRLPDCQGWHYLGTVMDVRLRFPELLAEHRLTPYKLSKASGGRISLSTAYRLTRNRGVVKMFDADLLEVLCEVLGVEPGQLITRGPPPPARKRRK